MRTALMLGVLGVAATGCLNDSESPPLSPAFDEVVVFEPGPHLQQCGPIAVTRTQSAARLTNAGVEVLRTSCGIIEGVAHPTVCGAETGEILLHDIPTESLADAEAAGFGLANRLKEIGPGTGWRRAACPQHLHAIEVARSTAQCADIRNRVFRIESALDYGERVMLLDQAGTCADAGYRQVLYGNTGENVLCSNEESIAGPRRSCPVRRYADMFDTILANLDKPDLGLAGSHTVYLIHPDD